MLIYTHTNWYILLHELSQTYLKLFQMGQWNKIDLLFYQGEMKSTLIKAHSVDEVSWKIGWECSSPPLSPCNFFIGIICSQQRAQEDIVSFALEDWSSHHIHQLEDYQDLWATAHPASICYGQSVESVWVSVWKAVGNKLCVCLCYKSTGKLSNKHLVGEWFTQENSSFSSDLYTSLLGLIKSN